MSIQNKIRLKVDLNTSRFMIGIWQGLGGLGCEMIVPSPEILENEMEKLLTFHEMNQMQIG